MNALVEQLKSTVSDTNATDIRAAFASDPKRFAKYSMTLDDMLFDYSKCAVNEKVLDGLEAIARLPRSLKNAMRCLPAISSTSPKAVRCCTPHFATGRIRRFWSMART